MSEYDDNENSSLNASSVPKDIVEDILGFETGISTNTGFLAHRKDDSAEDTETPSEEDGANGLEFIPYVDYRQLESEEIKEETVYDGIVIWDEELEELDHISDAEREELQEYKDGENLGGEPVEEEEPEPEEPPAIYTEDEYNEAISKALVEGQSIGFDAGREEALTEEDIIKKGILESISQRFLELKVQIQQSESEYLELAVNVAMGIVKKLFPSLAFKYNTNEILSVIEQAVEVAATQPRLIVRVSEDHKRELEETIISIAHSHAFEGRLVVRADENIGHSNVQIDWGEGSAIRDPMVILSRINNTLAGVIEKSLWDCDVGIQDPGDAEMKKDNTSILSKNPTEYNLPNDSDDLPPPNPDNNNNTGNDDDDDLPPPMSDYTPDDDNNNTGNDDDDDLPPPMSDYTPDDDDNNTGNDDDDDDLPPPMSDYDGDDDGGVDMGENFQDDMGLTNDNMGDSANQKPLKSMDESFSDLEESMKLMGIEPE